MLESDILKNDAAEHHVENHGASAPEVHSGGVAPHEPGSAHENHDDHGHHQQSDTTERNGGNNNED
jgi:hypothetical protein